MGRKSKYADDEYYSGFDVACPYRSKPRTKPINAPVRCKSNSIDKNHGYPSHCQLCGWNRNIQQRRLINMVGYDKAMELMAQSDELAKKTEAEIKEGRYSYD